MPDNPKQITDRTRIMLRPLGNALPLGFFAFGAGVILMSAVELHWVQPPDARNVPLVLLAFVAPSELLACILAFLARDTAAATTMGIFALSWIPQSLVMMRQASVPSHAVGIFLAMMSVFIAALAITAYGSKPLLSVILGVTFLRTSAAAAVQLGIAGLNSTAAVLGIVVTVFSIYGGLAFLLEDAKQTDILPLFRRGPAKKAAEGDLKDQVVTMPNKPGVRRQL